MKGNVAVVECAWTGVSAKKPSNQGDKRNPMGVRRAEVYVFGEDGLVRERRIYANGVAVGAQARGEKNAPPAEPLPAGASEVHVAKGGPDEDRLLVWAKGFEDALNTKDVGQVTALLADDVKSEAWGTPPINGRRQNAEDLQSLFAAFPDGKWTPTNVWGIDGFVVIEHVFTGTQRLLYHQLGKVTGKPVTGQHFLEIWQPNAEGKLAHRWTYSNPQGGAEAGRRCGGRLARGPRHSRPCEAVESRGAAEAEAATRRGLRQTGRGGMRSGAGWRHGGAARGGGRSHREDARPREATPEAACRDHWAQPTQAAPASPPRRARSSLCASRGRPSMWVWRFRTHLAGSDLRVVRSDLRVVRTGLRVARSGLRAARSGLRAARSDLRVARNGSHVRRR
jgi:hypothetical protein